MNVKLGSCFNHVIKKKLKLSSTSIETMTLLGSSGQYFNYSSFEICFITETKHSMWQLSTKKSHFFFCSETSWVGHRLSFWSLLVKFIVSLILHCFIFSHRLLPAFLCVLINCVLMYWLCILKNINWLCHQFHGSSLVPPYTVLLNYLNVFICR